MSTLAEEALRAGRLRRQHEPHDPAQLEARPRARHRRAARGAARPRRRHRPRRPRRVPARLRPPGRRRRPGLARRPRRAHRGHRHLPAGPGRATRRTPAATRSPTAAEDAGRRPADHPAGGLPAHRDALRPAVVAAPVLHPPDLPRPSPTCRWPSGWPGCASPRCGPRSLAEEPGTRNPIALGLMQRWDQIFPLGDPPDYEPPRSASVAGVAEREGRHAAGGRPRLAARARRHGVPVRPAGQLRRPRPRRAPRDDDRPEHGARPLRRRRPLRPHLRREHADLPAHALGERARRAAPRLGLEQAISLQTSRTAAAYGFTDRGVLAAGQAGRPQPHRPRRHAPPRAGDGLRPARRRPPPRPAGRRLRRHARGRRGHRRARRAHRRRPGRLVRF